MKKLDLELIVGVFVLLGVACLGYLAVKLGGMEVLGGNQYELVASFSNAGGLKSGSSVQIAGVEVGRVRAITLKDYEAEVVLGIDNDVEIDEEAIASVKTRGLIGEKYVGISVGGSDVMLQNGDTIRETQPAVDLESLISKYVFSDESKGN
jgi:phospholipid/cholesterol/gamma-HCH transport system substrate-binding protein